MSRKMHKAILFMQLPNSMFKQGFPTINADLSAFLWISLLHPLGSCVRIVYIPFSKVHCVWALKLACWLKRAGWFLFCTAQSLQSCMASSPVVSLHRRSVSSTFKWNASLHICCLFAGDVSPISMSPISQSQFIPLGEILCLAISAMNSARKQVTQEALMEHLTTCFPGNCTLINHWSDELMSVKGQLKDSLPERCLYF